MEAKFNGNLTVDNKLMAVGKFNEEFQKWVIKNWDNDPTPNVTPTLTLITLPDVNTGFNIRLSSRVGFSFAIDRELTALGFDGLEDTDWENIGGNGIL